jgi:serine/threonine protein kinase
MLHDKTLEKLIEKRKETRGGARPGSGGRPRVTTSGGGRAGGVDIRNPLRGRPKVTMGRGGAKTVLSTVRPFLKRIPLPVVGALIDFGLSGIHGVGVGTGGTVPYCHPEIKNITDITRHTKYRWKPLDVKHDVWSLGVMFLTMYIYRDFHNYYYKYPDYFFRKDGYVSSLIIDVITHNKLNQIFTRILSFESITSGELCKLLEDIAS